MLCPICNSKMHYVPDTLETYQCTNPKCKAYCETENGQITISTLVKKYIEAANELEDGSILKDLEGLLELAKENGKEVDTDLYYVRLLLSKLSPCCYAPIVQHWSGNYFDEAIYVCSNCGAPMD